MNTQRTRSAGEGRSPSAGELGSVCGQSNYFPGKLSQPTGGSRIGDCSPRSLALRRIGVICVLALLGWLGIGTARAHPIYPTQGLAYQACASDLAGIGNRIFNQACEQVGNYYYCTAWTAEAGNSSTRSCGTFSGTNRGEYYGWPAGKTCGNEAQQTGRPWQSSATDIRDGTVSCESGCETAWFSNGDGTATGMPVGSVCQWDNPDMCDLYPGTYWNSKVMGCEPIEPETCPAGQMKNASGNCVDNQCPSGMVEGPTGTCINEKNECPAGEVKSPTGACLPGEGQCAQGEARGKDGTCKRDSDGDGTPDNEDDDPSNDDDKESFSGGDNCNSPPSCSGGPIDCGMARIQWRIECNTRRNETISGGACNAMPICKGEKCNAMEYSQLLQQWRATCALEKLAAGEGGGNDGGDGSQPAWTRVDGMNTNPGAGAGEGDAPTVRNRTFNTNDLDQSGFGGGGSCPGFAVGGGGGRYSNAFMTYLANPPAVWCNYIAYVKALMILIGSVAAVFIIARS